MPDIAAHIVGKVRHADFGSSSGDANRAHEQAHARFLLREDVLDEGSDLGAAAIGARRRFAHRPPHWLLVMDVGEVAILLQPRLVLL